MARPYLARGAPLSPPKAAGDDEVARHLQREEERNWLAGVSALRQNKQNLTRDEEVAKKLHEEMDDTGQVLSDEHLAKKMQAHLELELADEQRRANERALHDEHVAQSLQEEMRRRGKPERSPPADTTSDELLARELAESDARAHASRPSPSSAAPTTPSARSGPTNPFGAGYTNPAYTSGAYATSPSATGVSTRGPPVATGPVRPAVYGAPPPVHAGQAVADPAGQGRERELGGLRYSPKSAARAAPQSPPAATPATRDQGAMDRERALGGLRYSPASRANAPSAPAASNPSAEDEELRLAIERSMREH